MDEYTVDTTQPTISPKSPRVLDIINDFLNKIQLNMLPVNHIESKQAESKPNLTILAVNPFNYRTVVSFNFDKVTNQCYWDKRILKFYTLIMRTTAIDKSFIGLRINVNETDEFMMKLNISPVEPINLKAIQNFYEVSKEFVNLKSFYYEVKEVATHFAGNKTISIYLNGFAIPISPNSFIQANHIMGNILYDRLSHLVKPNKKLLVYGRNSFHIASQVYKKFESVMCLNPCPIAYQDGLEIIRSNNLNWGCVNTKESLYQEINESSQPTTIIMSPGRSGYCHFDKIDLSKMKNKQIFYITCNEETMKKDIKDHFIITDNIMIELFPGTIYNEHIIQLSI